MSERDPRYQDDPPGFRGVRYVWPRRYLYRSRSRATARLIFGLVLLTLGVLWTLDNLHVVDSEKIIRWWPALLVLAGVMRLSGVGARRQPVAGTVFTLIGLLLLGNEFDIFVFHFSQLWPVVIMALGALLVVRSLRGPSAARVDSGSSRYDQVNAFAMWAGANLKNESQSFQGGDVSAVMGGVDLDLRGARTQMPQVVIDIFAWWGGIDIRVPRDWRVVSEVTPFMGGFDDKSIPVEGGAATTLVLRGVVVMGGIEVKN